MALVTKITFGTGAPAAQLIAGGAASIFFGVAATSAEAATYFIKLYWEGTGTAPPTTAFGSQPATTTPVVGTTKPSLTIPVGITGTYNLSFLPVTNGGRLWIWATANAADTDTTALTAGGDQVSIFYG